MALQLSLLEMLERPTLESLTKLDDIYRSEDGEFVARLPEDTRFDRKSAGFSRRNWAFAFLPSAMDRRPRGASSLLGSRRTDALTAALRSAKGRSSNSSSWGLIAARMSAIGAARRRFET
jgi:hypothetical protein